MLSEIIIAIKRNTKITYSVWWCDAMINDGRREEASKFASFSGRTYNDEIVLLAFSLGQLFIIQSEILLRQLPILIRERYVSAVDNVMYPWVLSVYKW